MSVSAPVNARLLSSLQAMLSSEEDVVRTSAAKTLGIVSQVSILLIPVMPFMSLFPALLKNNKMYWIRCIWVRLCIITMLHSFAYVLVLFI